MVLHYVCIINLFHIAQECRRIISVSEEEEEEGVYGEVHHSKYARKIMTGLEQTPYI